MEYNEETIAKILNDQKQELLTNPNYREISRSIDYSLHLRTPEVSVITGVRRSGKSTLLRQIGAHFSPTANVHYVNFEDQRLSTFTVNHFRIFFERFLVGAALEKPILVIYDELQVVEEWERWIAELSGKKNCKVMISGSNAKLLSSEMATLLTGRHRDIHLWPLSFHEIARDLARTTPELIQETSTLASVQKQKILDDYVTFGGFPRAFLDRESSILRQYYADIVFKDIVQRKKIRNINAVQDIGGLLCSTNTRLFSKRKVAEKTLDITALTVAKFCGYFSETFLFSEISLFSRSKRKQLAGRSKFYCVDPILAKEVGFHFSGDTAYWVLENHVCNELLRREYAVYYWHAREKQEVDFIAVSSKQEKIAVQVALSLGDEDTQKREVRALEAAELELGIKKLMIITLNEAKLIPIASGNTVEVVRFADWALHNDTVIPAPTNSI
jgi:predicted AAA+ superfamily ATPase